MKHRIAAVVLAAGLSSRMAPRNKLLTPMAGGGAMIAQTVGHVLASKASPVIVVTGFQASLVAAELTRLPIRLVHASDFSEGLSASLRAGIAALPPETEAVLIVLGDMPLVEQLLLDQLLAAYDPLSKQDILVPIWQGRRGNPRLWGRRHFDALKSLAGDAGAGRLLAVYPESIAEVISTDNATLRDFDTLKALDTLP